MLGGFFGIGEDAMKKNLKASAESVLETKYQSDEAAMKKTLDKSWVYFQRAHLHLGVIGTAALIQSLLLAFLNMPAWIKSWVSIMLGLGSIGYGSFWLLAGLIAPGLGSTGAAKDSLRWLGQPSAALCILGTAGVLFAVLKWSRSK